MEPFGQHSLLSSSNFLNINREYLNLSAIRQTFPFSECSTALSISRILLMLAAGETITYHSTNNLNINLYTIYGVD